MATTACLDRRRCTQNIKEHLDVTAVLEIYQLGLRAGRGYQKANRGIIVKLPLCLDAVCVLDTSVNGNKVELIDLKQELDKEESEGLVAPDDHLLALVKPIV